MTEQAETALKTQGQEEAVLDDATPEQSGWKSKVVVAGIVSTVILGECFLAYMVLPSAEEIAQMAGHVVDMDAAARAKQNAELPKEEAPPEIEITLGKFNVTAFQPMSRSTRLIDFELFGMIREEDKSEFERLKSENENRFREQVMLIIRNSAEDELTDSHWGLLKNKILDRINHLLGKPLLRSIHFSEFSLMEQ